MGRLISVDSGFFPHKFRTFPFRRIDEGHSAVGNYLNASADLHGRSFSGFIGPSPSGKAAGFGPAIPRFES